MANLDQETTNVKLQLDSYKQFVKSEREKLQGLLSEAQSQIDQVQYEFESIS